MTNLTNWLNANKISLNVKKTELVIFKHKKKKLECPIRSKLSRKRLNSSNSVKYVCVKSYENLNRKDHIHDIATKLNRAKAILLKITNYLNCNTFKLIYFAIFDSDINYTNLKWGKTWTLHLEHVRFVLSFVPKFTTMIQSHHHLIHYSNLHIELTPMAKKNCYYRCY